MTSDIIRIAIVDDHKIFRAGMELILNGFDTVKVVVSAEDGKSLLHALKNIHVDIIFMDIRLQEDDGVEITKHVLKKYPDVKIIGLTMYSEVEYFNKMMDAGASGFLLKNTREDELEKAINSVNEGNFYASKEFQHYFKNLHLDGDFQRHGNIQLTDREKEVLECIAQGLSNHEIAKKLFLSAHTVDGHRRNLLAKLSVKNSASLVMYAVKMGLLKP